MGTYLGWADAPLTARGIPLPPLGQGRQFRVHLREGNSWEPLHVWLVITPTGMQLKQSWYAMPESLEEGYVRLEASKRYGFFPDAQGPPETDLHSLHLGMGQPIALGATTA